MDQLTSDTVNRAIRRRLLKAYVQTMPNEDAACQEVYEDMEDAFETFIDENHTRLKRAGAYARLDRTITSVINILSD